MYWLSKKGVKHNFYLERPFLSLHTRMNTKLAGNWLTKKIILTQFFFFFLIFFYFIYSLFARPDNNPPIGDFICICIFNWPDWLWGVVSHRRHEVVLLLLLIILCLPVYNFIYYLRKSVKLFTASKGKGERNVFFFFNQLGPNQNITINYKSTTWKAYRYYNAN